MKLLKCQSCGQIVFFENTVCGRCGHPLGFLPDQITLSAAVSGMTVDLGNPLALASRCLALTVAPLRSTVYGSTGGRP